MKYYNLEKFLKNIVVFSNNDLKLLDDKYNSAKVNSWLDSWYIKKIRNWFYVLSNANFSEDLYFDNFWLNEEDFEKLTSEIKKELELLWFEVEIKNVHKVSLNTFWFLIIKISRRKNIDSDWYCFSRLYLSFHKKND